MIVTRHRRHKINTGEKTYESLEIGASVTFDTETDSLDPMRASRARAAMRGVTSPQGNGWRPGRHPAQTTPTLVDATALLP